MAEGINKYSSVALNLCYNSTASKRWYFKKSGVKAALLCPALFWGSFSHPASWVLFPKAHGLGMFLQRRRAESGRKNPDNPKSVSANWMGVIS